MWPMKSTPMMRCAGNSAATLLNSAMFSGWMELSGSAKASPPKETLALSWIARFSPAGKM